MTGKEALKKVLECKKAYIRKHHHKPQRLIFGWELAIDLCKCDWSEIGRFVELVSEYGEEAFEIHGFHGIPVTIERDHFDNNVRGEAVDTRSAKKTRRKRPSLGGS